MSAINGTSVNVRLLERMATSGVPGSVCTPDPEENPFPPVRSRAGRRGD